MKLVLGSDLEFVPVDAKYFRVLRISSMIWTAVFFLPSLAIVLLILHENSFTFPSILFLLIPLTILTLGIWGLYIAKRRARALGYIELDDELIVRKGVIFQKMEVVPYGRMQQVTINAGPLLNRYKLAEIKLLTAAMGSDVTIPGLSRAEAEHLRIKLTELGTAQMEGL